MKVAFLRKDNPKGYTPKTFGCMRPETIAETLSKVEGVAIYECNDPVNSEFAREVADYINGREDSQLWCILINTPAEDAEDAVTTRLEKIYAELEQTLTREQIIRGSRRDGEKPLGYLLTYLKDNYGLPKQAGFKVATDTLWRLGISNEHPNGREVNLACLFDRDAYDKETFMMICREGDGEAYRRAKEGVAEGSCDIYTMDDLEVDLNDDGEQTNIYYNILEYGYVRFIHVDADEAEKWKK